jgi:hypothetical protein
MTEGQETPHVLHANVFDDHQRLVSSAGAFAQKIVSGLVERAAPGNREGCLARAPSQALCIYRSP